MIPLDRIQEIVAARGDKPAIVTHATRGSPPEVLSWRAFQERVAAFSAALSAAIDARELRTVCALSPNRPELLVAAAAAATLKLTYFGLDYTLEPEVLSRLVEETDVDVLVVSSHFLARKGIDISALARQRKIVDLDGRLPGAIQIGGATRLPPPEPRPFRAVSFTSGTTGKPKPVIRNASFDARRFTYFATRYGFSSHDRHLVTIPLYHAAGNGWARLFLGLGATVVLAPPEDPAAAADLIRSEWITTGAMTPPILAGVLRHAAETGLPLQPNLLRFILVGGKHFPVALKQEAIAALGPVIYEYYGTTETGVNAIAEPGDLITTPASVGRPYDGNRIAILDAESRPVPQGLVGTVAVSSYMNMDGYLGAPARKAVVEGERYLVTSEAGYLDDEGRLFLLNRTKGEETFNVYALENLARQVTGVDDVALLARAGGGRRVDCALALRATATWSLEDIERHVRSLFAKEGVTLGRFRLLDRIPYSPSGKVRERDLEALFSHADGAPTPAARAHGGSPTRRGHISALATGAALLSLTAISWGGMFPVAKSALNSMDGYYLTLFRYGFASLILLAILAFKEGLGALSLDGRGVRLFVLGSLGFAGFSTLAFVGLQRALPEHGAIIMALMPLITALLLWRLKGARPNQITFACIAVALAGVVLVVTRGDFSILLGGAVLPDLLILAGATCWVAYTIGAAGFQDWSALRYTALTAGLGTLTILLVTAGVTFAGVSTPPSIEQILRAVPEITYLVLIAAVLAVFTWNIGIGTLGPMNGVLFINLVPMTTFLIGVAGGRTLSDVEITGAALTIGALLINNLNARGVFRRLASQGRTRHLASS